MSVLPYINETDKRSLLKITPVTGRIGAVVHDIRLSADLDEQQIAAIRAALIRHKVLFIRDQAHLDDAGQEAFGLRLGKVFTPPLLQPAAGTSNIFQIDSMHHPTPSSWHTDVTCFESYLEASILRGVVIPEAGGDTMWANTAAAYQSLPDSLRNLVDTLWATHSSDFDYSSFATEADKKRHGTKALVVYEAEHPLVRIHPLSGERTMILGHYLKKISGLSTADSQHLYQILQDHITRPENTVRWHWKVGDVVMWDNRATQHRVVADFGTQRRHVRRVSLDGDIPVSIDGRRSRQLKPAQSEAAAAEWNDNRKYHASPPR